jgi:hypothetical protein
VSKKITANRMSGNGASWSITTTMNSTSPTRVSWWLFRNPCSATNSLHSPMDAAVHGQHRRSRTGGSLQRQPPNGGLPGQRRDPDQPRRCAKPHAKQALTDDLPGAAHHPATRPMWSDGHACWVTISHHSRSAEGNRHYENSATERLAVIGDCKRSLLQAYTQLKALQQP